MKSRRNSSRDGRALRCTAQHRNAPSGRPGASSCDALALCPVALSVLAFALCAESPSAFWARKPSRFPSADCEEVLGPLAGSCSGPGTLPPASVHLPSPSLPAAPRSPLLKVGPSSPCLRSSLSSWFVCFALPCFDRSGLVSSARIPCHSRGCWQGLPRCKEAMHSRTPSRSTPELPRSRAMSRCRRAPSAAPGAARITCGAPQSEERGLEPRGPSGLLTAHPRDAQEGTHPLGQGTSGRSSDFPSHACLGPD